MLHRILAYHLAALVFLSNIGIPVFTHVCHGQSKQWLSVVLPARSCCSKKAKVEKACHTKQRHSSGQKGIKTQPCCENHAALAQLHSSFLSSVKAWSVKSLDVASSQLSVALAALDFFPIPTSHFSFQPHAPPLLLYGRSLLVFQQVFRC